jgi:hypothetical protein
MCDFSPQHVASRDAEVGDKLIVSRFAGTITRGFTAIGESGQDVRLPKLSWDVQGMGKVCVCLKPGTELAFDKAVTAHRGFFSAMQKKVGGKLARFRQINKDDMNAHHDAIEFPNGDTVLINSLGVGQCATVLQLPAKPKTEAEAQDQKRLEVTG